MTKDFFKTRPLSWSSISSFEYDPEQWYKKYILDEKEPDSKEMIFGKHFANAIENAHPKQKKSVINVSVLGQQVAVPVLDTVEQEFKVTFGDIPLIGFADSFCSKSKKKLYEFKTGKKAWDQARVDEHGQITMYCLMNYITNKIAPEDMELTLVWFPTQENGDFSISFTDAKPQSFSTKRTTKQMLEFGSRINQAVNQMIEYVKEKEANKV